VWQIKPAQLPFGGTTIIVLLTHLFTYVSVFPMIRKKKTAHYKPFSTNHTETTNKTVTNNTSVKVIKLLQLFTQKSARPSQI